jgi:hypothetical protein
MPLQKRGRWSKSTGRSSEVAYCHGSSMYAGTGPTYDLLTHASLRLCKLLWHKGNVVA